MSKLISAENGPGQIKLLSFLVLICKLSLIRVAEGVISEFIHTLLLYKSSSGETASNT